MKVAFDIRTGAPVGIDGKPIQCDPLDGSPFLHVFPRMWLPISQEISAIDLLMLKIDELGVLLNEPGLISVRPFNNSNYVAFRTGDQLGLLFKLDASLPDSLTVTFTFRVQLKSGCSTKIIHEQHLLPSRSEVGVDSYSTEFLLPTVPCESQFAHVFSKKFKGELTRENPDPHTIFLVTHESLAPLVNRFVHHLKMPDRLPIRDQPRDTALTSFNAEHRRNCIVEAPYKLLSDALELVSAHKEFKGLPEHHPAMKLICNWWNTHQLVPAVPNLRRAAMFRIYLRLNNRDEYQDLDIQAPPFPITRFCPDTAACSARIGDHFLIVFQQGAEAVTPEPYGFKTYLVNGAVYDDIEGIPASNFDYTDLTLQNMALMRLWYPGLMAIYDQNLEITN